MRQGVMPAKSRRSFLDSAPRYRAIIVVTILVAPILGAIWLHRWFVTQDGSIYLYNAHIILESLKSNSPFQDYYSVQRAPLPYWGAYVLLGALMSIFSERIADHVMASIASVGFLASILWLRHRVAGWQRVTLITPFAILVSINLLWLLGLYNFLLGACCYVAALGFWWSGRDNFGPGRAMLMSVLLVAGYLCHPVTSVLTAGALIILCLVTPGAGWRRAGWTLVSLLPAIVLTVFYGSLIPGGGETSVRWTGLADPLSIRQWLIYLRAADITPIAHAGPTLFFSRTISGWSHLPAVSTWAVLGLILLSISGFLNRRTAEAGDSRERRGFWFAAVLLGICGLFGPTDFGQDSGGFLRQRLLVIALATAVPVLAARRRPVPLDRPKRAGPANLLAKLGFGALLAGCVIQLATLWGYADASDQMATEFMQAKPYAGTGQRVAVLIIEPESDYEPKPLLHVSNLFGIGTGNVIWNNYAPALYYFPVQFRNASDRTLFYARGIPDFEQQEISQQDLEDWEDLLSEIEGRIDRLVVWGRSPQLDEINSEWFDDAPVFESEHVRVFMHTRPEAGDHGGAEQP